MGDRISGFKTPADAARYYQLYDAMAADWPVPHDELDVPTRFGATHVRRSGPAAGTPFVLIHPTTGSALGWQGMVETLAAHHPVYLPDTMGTAGRSVQTAPLRSEGDLVGWLDDTLDALGLERVHLVGYSEGGWIAGLHAALTGRPERLATLTLIEPGGAIERIPPATLFGIIVRAMGTLAARDKRRAIRRFNRWLSGDIPLTEQQIDYILLVFKTFRQRIPRPTRLPDERLRRITMPTLLLLGADTRIYDPAKVAARARRLLPNVTVETTPGAGHGLPLQFPERILPRIVRFVDGERQPRPAGA
jgi:pimeloyl-ACP methyl ester carboxylesterase